MVNVTIYSIHGSYDVWQFCLDVAEIPGFFGSSEWRFVFSEISAIGIGTMDFGMDIDI